MHHKILHNIVFNIFSETISLPSRGNGKVCVHFCGISADIYCIQCISNLPLSVCFPDDYFLSRLPVVEKRLAQGGVRLAEVLNRIFTKKPSDAAQ